MAAALGNMWQLQRLVIDGNPFYDDDERASFERLVAIGKLNQLEVLELGGIKIAGHELARLACIPRLKAINLAGTIIADAGLGELTSVESLEELMLDEDGASAAGLESLLALKRLKALHIDSDEMDDSLTPLSLDRNGRMFVRESEVHRCRQALEALRHSKPGIVIDSDTTSFDNRRQRRGQSVKEYPPPADRNLPTVFF